jgi:hypothetical protein
MSHNFALNPDAQEFSFSSDFSLKASWNASANDFVPFVPPPSQASTQPTSVSKAETSPPPAESKPPRRVYTYEVLISLRESNRQLPEGVVIPDTYSKTGSKSKPGKKGSQPSKPAGIKRAENQLNTLSILVKTEKPFTEKVKKQADELEKKSREIRSILNKLTDRNFEKLLAELTGFEYDSQLLANLTNFIFERATALNFPGLYSKLCSSLRKNFKAKNLSSQFRKSIVEKCRECFYNEDVPVEGDKLMEAEFKRRRKLIGNIKFIALLHQVKMIKSVIMFECFEVLLDPKSLSDETLETCITLFKDTCPLLVASFAEDVRKYFDKIVGLMGSSNFCKRILFMIQDLIEAKEVIMIPRGRPPVKKNVKKSEDEVEEAKVEPEEVPNEIDSQEENYKEDIRKFTKNYVKENDRDDWKENFSKIFKDPGLYLEGFVQIIKHGLYEFNKLDEISAVSQLVKVLVAEFSFDSDVIQKILAQVEKDLGEIVIDSPGAQGFFNFLKSDLESR